MNWFLVDGFIHFYVFRSLTRYETDNGILAEESGRIEKLESGDDGIRSTGYFQYTGDDGQLYRVDYVADDNGFVPKVGLELNKNSLSLF